MPCNYKDYPANWKEIIAEKKRKHNNKCELCYAPNGEQVTRMDNTNEYPWRPGYISCWKHVGGVDSRMPMTKIVLTVHHIDSDKTNNSDANLILLCQRCHLRLDMEKHVKNRKRR